MFQPYLPSHSNRPQTQHPTMPGLMLALVTCMSLLQPGAGYSTGAPSEACLTLQPGHGGQPGDNADSPYQLTVSPQPWIEKFYHSLFRSHHPAWRLVVTSVSLWQGQDSSPGQSLRASSFRSVCLGLAAHLEMLSPFMFMDMLVIVPHCFDGHLCWF